MVCLIAHFNESSSETLFEMIHTKETILVKNKEDAFNIIKKNNAKVIILSETLFNCVKNKTIVVDDDELSQFLNQVNKDSIVIFLGTTFIPIKSEADKMAFLKRLKIQHLFLDRYFLTDVAAVANQYIKEEEI